MARFLPPYLDKNCKSEGERIIFKRLRDSTITKDWIILHSLNLAEHTKRLYGEIDFLFLIPKGGIYVLEVKGGDVKCKDGIWYYTNRIGKSYSSTVGPFNQARDAMFSLKTAIKKKFGINHNFNKILMGFAVAFPNVFFDLRSVEYEDWQILDKKGFEDNFDLFFQNLVERFVEKNKYQHWFSPNISLPEIEVLKNLCEFLRGDFERVRTVKDRLEEFNKRVIAYTGEQYKILDSIQLNDRSLVQGSAGTGKTMIAMESAVRAASTNKKVLLTCYNRLIGEWMEKQLEDWNERITVTSLHKFLFQLSQGFDYDKSQGDKEDFFTKYLPQLLRDLFVKGISEKFDKLILDEGQDLIREEYLDLFDALLKNGLNKGSWEIYGDFEQQAIFAQKSKTEMVELLKKRSNYSNFILKINCRNTKEIGEETSLISGFEKPPFLLDYLQGIPVEYVFYKDNSDQIKKLHNQIDKLLGSKLPYNDLVILSPKKFDNSCVVNIDGYRIIDINKHQAFSVGDFLTFSTIQGFKGMECNYVIITDIDDLSTEKAMSLMYVAMSRARYGLILMVSEKVRNRYKEILSKRLI
ncbi:MAG: hypothetical protein Kow0098_01360 [Ignavibacteriaceae bacterium]